MRRPTLLLCALLALTLTAPAAARKDRKPRYTPVVLANGLRVFVIEDHRTPTLALVTWYRVGSKDEVKGRTGFAHLFEHMMFKGSAHTDDGVIDVLFEEAGGWTNAFTSSDETVYLDLADSSFLEPALWLEADRLAGLTDTLDQAKLDNQREVVRNERRQSYENRPYGMADLLIQEALWPEGHGYHWPTIGYHEDLVAATTDDVKAFFRNYYIPNSATLVVAGDVDTAHTLKLVTRFLGWIPRAPEPVRPSYAEPPPITQAIVLQTEDDVQVPRVYFTWRGPKVFSADEPALELAAGVLADGKTSRLYERLVYKERLAQEVNAGFTGEALGGTFQIAATAKPGVAPEALAKVIEEEVARLAMEPASADELARAQSVREAGFLRGLEDLMERAVQLARYDVLAGDANFLDRDLARYRRVTPKEVSRAAARWLTPDARVVLTVVPRPVAKQKGN
ncbi:MAG: insulinase family protein [Myxococcales bacterium]|nr:insulinase family protein [Myxococcales bacterium]